MGAALLIQRITKEYAGDAMKAIIPAAGLGLRFLPLTKEQPKEMLPVVDKPTIQYVIEEAVASGIDDILIITGRKKTSIEDHFDRSYELEATLQKLQEVKYLESIRGISDLASIYFIRQKEQRGLGDAVLAAKRFVGDEPFAVMLGDTINIASRPVLSQLMDVHERFGVSTIAVEPVSREKIKDYGIVRARPIAHNVLEVEDLVEKPLPENAPSNIGITGTYILNPSIFNCVERTPPGKNGEVQLTDAMKLMLQNERMMAVQFEGRRYDIGDMMGWLKTNMELSLAHPIYGEELRRFTRSLLDKDRDH